MNWMLLIYPISVFVVLLIGAYGLDPTGKYRKVVISVLTQVKEITPDNIDEIIDEIIDALEFENLNPESRIARKMIRELKTQIRKQK